MGREPNWWKKGYNDAKKNSRMSLPEEHFKNDIEKLQSDNFNPIKTSYSYALNWVETQQWRQDVGEKIVPFLKKYTRDSRKIEEFTDRMIAWVDGYAYYMVEQYILYWLSLPREVDEEIISALSAQVLGEVVDGSTDFI